MDRSSPAVGASGMNTIVIGWVVFKDAEKPDDLSVVMNCNGPKLFNSYESACEERDWLDTAEPVTAERFSEICRIVRK